MKRALPAGLLAGMLAALLAWCIAPAAAWASAAESAAVVANLYLPAESNPVMGIDAYLTNASNPIDGTGIPNTPTTETIAELTDNGDGTYMLVLQVVNPAFTLQAIGTCEHATVVSLEVTDEVSRTDSTEIETRICELTILLDSAQDSYTFEGCTLYPTPLGTYLEDVPLILVVDFDGDGVAAPAEEEDEADDAASGDATEGALPTNEDGTIAAGEYTVTANIWLEKSVTGLPLNPHLTSDELPPMDPVEDNATLVVDEDGGCLLYIPIAIQARIMTITSVTGENIVEMEYDEDGGVCLVVMDLGVLTGDDSVLSGTCTVEASIGETAQAMASGVWNGVYDYTWEAQWEIELAAGEAAEGEDDADDAVAAAVAAALAAVEASRAEADAGADDEEVAGEGEDDVANAGALADNTDAAADETAADDVENEEALNMYDGLPTLVGLVLFLAIIVVGAIIAARLLKEE